MSQMDTNNEMLLASSYFGPASYFALLAKSTADIVWIEQMETYPKQSWRNRCTILTPQGKLDLIIPVKKPMGNHTPIHLVSIDNSSLWFLNHWRAITSAYNASPYFLYYRDEIEPFFQGTYTNLLELNLNLTQLLLKTLKINVPLRLTQEFLPPDSASDLRYRLSPKKTSYFSHFPEYNQVFGDTQPFHPDLSLLDVLFNLGPETKSYLLSLK